MLRSRFLLGIGGPAIAMTLLVLPSVRASADRLVPQLPPVPTLDQSAATYVPPYLVGPRSMSFDVNVFPALAEQAAPTPRAPTPAQTTPTASERDLKVRRLTREGCETPLSSLVGPEARRMVPGRCMA